ncbi:hypothetical protein MASR2M70_09760 [Bacillota bacterium]
MDQNNQNTITVSEDLINNDLRSKVFSSPAGEYIEDYKVSFSQGYIYLDLKARVKTLGALSAKYRVEIVGLIFKPGSHMLIADYVEDVSSAGGLAQSMMLKAASLKGGTFLQMLVNMSNPPGIKADEKSCSIDLEKLLKLDKRLTDLLALEYVDCRNGQLRLSYRLSF